MIPVKESQNNKNCKISIYLYEMYLERKCGQRSIFNDNILFQGGSRLADLYRLILCLIR